MEYSSVPILRGVQLYGYVDGTIAAIAVKVTIGTSNDAREYPNPEYETCYIQDLAIISGLLSLMPKDVLS